MFNILIYFYQKKKNWDSDYQNPITTPNAKWIWLIVFNCLLPQIMYKIKSQGQGPLYTFNLTFHILSKRL